LPEEWKKSSNIPIYKMGDSVYIGMSRLLTTYKINHFYWLSNAL